VLKIQSGGWPSILKQDCLTKIISVWGINILLRVIEVLKKKGSYSDVFMGVEGKLFCLKFNLEFGHQSYR
jgi:hypothetical protein